jgi:hypothetical protein
MLTETKKPVFYLRALKSEDNLMNFSERPKNRPKAG